MAETLKGTCLCEGVEYEVEDPQALGYCHCTRCQHWTGSSLAGIVVAKENFKFTKGEPRSFEWSSDAGNTRFGWFCGNCGSRIAHGQKPSVGILSVRSGTLDDTSWIEPVGDIWTRSAQPWVSLSGDRLRAEQQPTDYAPFIERFRSQGRFAF